MKIIGLYRENFKEYDYRLAQIQKEDDSMKVDDGVIEKLKMIGKIGEESTVLDKESSTEDIELKNDKLRMAANGTFTSIRANNCVFKGKWCYEVMLLSNKLSQIGWCQLTTPFKSKDGVGDDLTSFAYDGYRVMKWGGEKKKERYGKNWDYGDIVGVCIDLEQRTIEYFLNGQTLGIAFNNIPIGPNVAYYPGISLSKNEKSLFNFGSQEMMYKYPGYEPFDIPQSIYNNSLDITLELLDLVKTYIIKLLQVKDLERMFKFRISSQIFNFIANISFKYTHIFNKVILPFLLSICRIGINNNQTSLPNNQDLHVFFEHIYIYVENKAEFTSQLIEKISTLIEFHSARGIDGLVQREELMSLFLKLMNLDFIVQHWIEGRKYTDHLKSIISGNFLKTSDILYFIIEKINQADMSKEDKKNPKILKKFYLKLKEEFEEKQESKGWSLYEENINTSLCEVYNKFMNDARVFKVNNNFYMLNKILNEYYTKSMKDNSFQGVDIYHYLQGHQHFQANEGYIKYYYFNMLEIFSSNFNEDLSKFSIEPWISRGSRDGNLYYDELGVGGTILHVTQEYGDQIESIYKDKQDNQLNYIFHRLLNLTSTYLTPFMKDTAKNAEHLNEFKLSQFEDETKRGGYIHTYFRTYFNVFTVRNQILLYQLAYFIINWLNTLIKANKNILYFIPKSIMQIPYDISRFLQQIKSPLLKRADLLTKANSRSSYFQENNFTHQVLYFYCYLFGDPKIAHPDLKEGFIMKISYFLRKKKLITYFEEKEDLLELLIKGLLKYMTIDSMCHIASENMVKIIKSSCFGEKRESAGKDTLIKVVQKFFATNSEVFYEFMDNYYKLLNKIMTDYTMAMTEASGRVRGIDDPVEHTLAYTKKMLFSYQILCDLMKILEFLLAAYPAKFFDVSNINFSRFSNFLKNLSSRILDKNYIDKLLNLIDKYKPGRSVETFSHLAYSVIGVMLNIGKNKDLQNFNEIISKLVSQADFDVEPFYNVLKYVKKNDQIEQGLQNYKDFIDFMSSLKLTKVEKKMSEAEWEEKVNREDICIICYVNVTDRVMLPCKHGKIIVYNIIF